MTNIYQYITIIFLFLLIGCNERVEATIASQNVSKADQRIIPAAPPMSSHCIDKTDRLCPFEYSEEERKERAKIKQVNANLPKSKNDICDVSQYQKVVFEPFEKEIFPAIKAEQIDVLDYRRAGPWKAGSIRSDRQAIPVDIYKPEPVTGGTPAILAFGSVAKINILDESFLFAKDIVVKPDDHPSWDGPSLFYFGYYEESEAFENMFWSRSNHLSFGEYNANDRGHIINPWITKMMRTYEHLHNGLYGNRELRYQHYKNYGVVVRREFQDFGYNYAPNHIVNGEAVGKYPDYSARDINLDSDLFENIKQHQLLYQSTLYLSDNAVLIETHKPRHIIAKITADRPIAEYKICD